MLCDEEEDRGDMQSLFLLSMYMYGVAEAAVVVIMVCE